MRYALRNQDKIAAKLGEDYLRNNILASLKAFFTSITEEEMEDFIDWYDGDKFYRLRVNDVADPDAMQEFYIIGRDYDVYRLAYIGRVKG